MTDILTPIPHAVLSQVRWAIGSITRFNDAIRQCRVTETHTGSCGRYEWEYRTDLTGRTMATQAQEAVAWLERFAKRARQLGIDPEAVLAALEGEAAPLPWSEAASAWLESEPEDETRQGGGSPIS